MRIVEGQFYRQGGAWRSLIGGEHGLARESAGPEEGHESFELEGALVLLVAQHRHVRYTEDMNLLVRAYLFRLVLP